MLDRSIWSNSQTQSENHRMVRRVLDQYTWCEILFYWWKYFTLRLDVFCKWECSMKINGRGWKSSAASLNVSSLSNVYEIFVLCCFHDENISVKSLLRSQIWWILKMFYKNQWLKMQRSDAFLKCVLSVWKAGIWGHSASGSIWVRDLQLSAHRG